VSLRHDSDDRAARRRLHGEKEGVNMTRTAVLAALAAAVLASGAPVSGQQADMVQAHIGHVMDSFGATPDKQGLLPTALAEAKIAAQHAAFAAKTPDNLDAMKLHAGHVLHALDPSVEAQGPGLGYGVKRAAQGVAQHIQLAAKSEGASKNVLTHAAHVAASATNVAQWSDELVALAQKVRGASSAADAAPLVAQLQTRSQQLMSGVDANNDGRISWEPGEGGLQQAQQHMELLLKGEGAQ
jgi:hypothetical protein